MIYGQKKRSHCLKRWVDFNICPSYFFWHNFQTDFAYTESGRHACYTPAVPACISYAIPTVTTCQHQPLIVADQVYMLVIWSPSLYLDGTMTTKGVHVILVFFSDLENIPEYLVSTKSMFIYFQIQVYVWIDFSDRSMFEYLFRSNDQSIGLIFLTSSICYFFFILQYTMILAHITGITSYLYILHYPWYLYIYYIIIWFFFSQIAFVERSGDNQQRVLWACRSTILP